MDDRTLGNLMAEAARRATEACLARGFGRADNITIKSAHAAAEAIYREHRRPDPAPPITLPDAPPLDPMKERIDRDPRERAEYLAASQADAAMGRRD